MVVERVGPGPVCIRKPRGANRPWAKKPEAATNHRHDSFYLGGNEMTTRENIKIKFESGSASSIGPQRSEDRMALYIFPLKEGNIKGNLGAP